MKLETLKKNNKKKILIGGLIGVCLVSVIGFTATKAKYKSIQNIKVATGSIKLQEKYDLKVMALYQSEDGSNYSEVETMPGSDYIVNEEKSYCTTDNKTQVKGKIKTVNGIHGLYSLKKNDKCYIWFDKKIEPLTSETIIAGIKSGSEYHSGNPTFTNAATTNEGIYSMADGMYGGYSYYWRGAATTNHVIFANKCWRIVRINGDGTMRLIYNGAVLNGNKCTGNGSNAGSIAVTSQKYNTSSNNRSEYVGYTYTTGSQRTTGGTASNLKTQTDNWYNTNIGNNATYSNKVADGKFCNDRNTGSGYSWSSQPSSTFYYAGYDRSGARNANTVNPTLSCPSGDIYTLKAGAITADEVVMAGSKMEGDKYEISNTMYYLYNGQYYWTMSPSYWLYYDYGGGTVDYSASVFAVYSDGKLRYYRISGTDSGVRPVINLKANTLFNGNSDGTKDNPYIVQ